MHKLELENIEETVVAATSYVNQARTEHKMHQLKRMEKLAGKQMAAKPLDVELTPRAQHKLDMKTR